jgi:hypothetical protein
VDGANAARRNESEPATPLAPRDEQAARQFFRGLVGWTLGILLLIAAANALVDPYRAHPSFELPLDRAPVAKVMNERLWKMIAFDRAPAARIVLGDSRCDHLRDEYFVSAGVAGVANLGFGGATLPEILAAYDFARSRTHLEWVVLCMSLDVYNEARITDRVSELEPLVDRPQVYYLSPFVLRTGFAEIRHSLTGYTPSERPAMSRAAFWERQIGPDGVGRSYASWRRPTREWKRLTELAMQCRQDGTSLVFVIPPNHVDLQASVDAYGLRTEYQAMKTRLAGLAPVVDFDFPNPVTRNAADYDDPFHPRPEVSQRIVEELLRNTRTFSRTLGDARRIPFHAAQ